MPATKSRKLLDEVLAAQEPENRYLDMCLVLRRQQTQETLLWAGGRWDLLDERWSDEEPHGAQIIDLHEGQVPFTQWFATWLRDFREGFPRDVSLALAGGERRGGKTFDLVCCFLATLIDVPKMGSMPTRGWLVSVAHAERDELDQTVKKVMLPHWYKYREHPKHVYTFAHGALATNISADDPETLKRGTVDIIFYNEAQKMPRAVLTNGIGGTADHGGVAILAANPPQRSKGEWVYDIKQDIESGEYGPIAKFFGFDATLNPFIDQDAKRRIGKLLRRIDPAAALADDEGVWKKPGDIAYEAWDRTKHIRRLPSVASGDITREITAEFTKRRVGIGYPIIGGYDPNGRPHHAGTFWKVYGTIDQPILMCIDELLVEHADGEEHFLECVGDKGYTFRDVIWVMDASCFFQNDKHQQNGVVSFDYFRKWQYKGEPPQPPSAQSKTGRARNPDIELRVALMNKLLSADRMLIAGDLVPSTHAGEPPRLTPLAPQLAEALKNCASKRVRHGYGPVGKYSHVTDTAGYVAWWCFPKPKAPSKGGGIDVMAIDLPRPRAF